MVGRRLRSITGWALVMGAVGMLIDAWAASSLDPASPDWLTTIILPGGLLDDGSVGLIPAYIGGTVGLIGFVFVLQRLAGVWMALLAGLGVIGTLVFWYSYPFRATFGGVGAVLIGIAVLSLPNWGRFTSPLWVASGVMWIPELVTPGINWGPIASFTLLGAAIGVTGAFVFSGIRAAERSGKTPPLHTAAQPAQ